MAKRRILRHGDDGNALVVAVMVTAVCLSLALIGVQTGLTAGRSSGVDRQRLLAVNAAESGVDNGYAAIQMGLLNPPCSASSGNVRSGPDVASYTTTFTYYGIAGNDLTSLCSPSTPSVLNSNAAPVKALITSVATTNPLGGGTTTGKRTMQALVNLSPVNGNSMKKAIFAQGTMSFSNQTTLTGTSGADADVYSNTNVDCSNNENFAGSVYSQGDISISNKCTFAGNVWAAGKVTTNNGSNGSIAGFVKAGTGVINLSGVSVTGNLTAGSTISYGVGCTSGKCYPNSSPGAPPTVPFPILRGDAPTMTAWQAGAPTATPPVAAFTVYYDNNCSTVKDDIVNTFAKKGSPTLVRTSCAVNFSKDKTIPLSNDLAIFADGGFTSSNQVGFSSSSSGTNHNLYWVQPYDAVPHPCNSTGISTDQQFSLTGDVDMFLYSACNIAFSNSSRHVGQIYGGGNVQINNQFNLQFKEIGVVGIDPASQPTVGYNASVVYKRETR